MPAYSTTKLTPGLISGDGAAIARRLAEKYVSKTESLILLCLAAGASEYSTYS